MGVLYSVGGMLMSGEELQEKAAIGGLRTFTETVEGGATSLDWSGGTLSVDDVARAAEKLPFEPIGLHKPLTIELLAAYTGDAPGRSFIDRVFGRDEPDLLIVSASKTPRSFNAAPRAINQLIQQVEDKVAYRPGATREGCALIYHSPAAVDATTYVSVEMVVDSFSGEAIEQISKVMSSAAGLPVFAPAATHLLAGSALIKIASKLGKTLGETAPFLKAHEDLRLDSAGFPPELARLMVFVSDTDIRKLQGYSPEVVEQAGSHRATLIHRQDGTEYDGPVPFIIASLDGRPRPEYEDFTPHHASAALIEQFYGESPVGTVGEVVTESLTLYNDLHYRKAAERMKSSVSQLPEGSDGRAAAEARLAAYVANIQTDELKADLIEEG